VADSEQLLNQMRPDEAGAASDQNSHAAKLATDGRGWTQILQLRIHLYSSVPDANALHRRRTIQNLRQFSSK
jgi:hypothetical protein